MKTLAVAFRWICVAGLFLYIKAQPEEFCPPLPVFANGNITYIGGTLTDNGYPRDTFARNMCNDEDRFRVNGPSSRACSGNFVNNVLQGSAWEPSGNVSCEPVCPPFRANETLGILSVRFPGRRVLNSTAVHECLLGYIQNGDLIRTCRPNVTTIEGIIVTLEWDLPEETCRRPCPNIMLGFGVENITYSDPNRDVNSTATHTCLPGYLPDRALNRTCLLGDNGIIANWDEPEVTCRPTCPEILRGVGIDTIIYSDPNRDIGSIATHTCLSGFVPNDDLRRVCEQGDDPAIAEWNLPEETCRPVCGNLPQLVNGEITYNPDEMPREINATATYECNRGFTYVEGDIIRTCAEINNELGLVGADWTGEAGRCAPNECPMLPPLGNGTIFYSPDNTPDFDSGTVATHMCNPGYVLRGSEICVCQIDGTWSPSPPVCEPQCPPLSVIDNGGLSYNNGPDLLEYNVGTVATYSCNDRYALIGAMTRVCQDSRQWTNEEPFCELIECPALPPLGNGTITYDMDMDPDFVETTVAIHDCNMPGFELVGPRIRTCRRNSTEPSDPDGMWDLSAPFCKPVCIELDMIVNGFITYNTDGPPYCVGTVANYACINDDYALVGDMTLECIDSLRWSRQPPTCQLKMCLPLEDPANGQIVYVGDSDNQRNYDLGTVADLECNFGFTRTGGPMTCVSFNSTSVIGVFVGPPPFFCQPIICPPLRSIPNGNISYSQSPFIVDTVANYSCNSGYCLNPSSVRVCQVDGTWSGVEGRCNLIICPVLTAPENGAITYSVEDTSMIPVGATATYSCIPSHSLVGGPEVRTCVRPDFAFTCPTTGTWTPSPPPTCSPSNIVNDTATGDPLMTVPLYIQDKSAIMSQSALDPNDIINLCYELHGNSDAFFNLVSDVCVSVNAHYEMVLPSDPREDVNIIDNIYVRATDNAGICRNIEVALNAGVCTASVDGVNIDSMYRSEGVYVRRYSNRVRIGVPNCNELDLVMWVFCLENRFWSSYRVDSFGREVVFDAPMIKFVIARGFNLQETSHGIIGQFWNIPIQVEAFTGSARPNVSTERYFEVTVNHPNEVRRFTGWLYPLTWEYRSEYCLYAGNQQAGPVYEVVSPNDAVIEGEYADYRVNSSYSTDFMYNEFDETRCT